MNTTIKATHKGECQLCGKRQLLPGDRLSLHGYAVKWKMFQGQCNGSQDLPYELSCDRIKQELDRVEAKIQNGLDTIASVNSLNGSIGFCKQWSTEARTYYWSQIDYKDIPEKDKIRHCLYGEPKELATKGNTQYVKEFLKPSLFDLVRYKSWCVDRIENWAVKELEIRSID